MLWPNGSKVQPRISSGYGPRPPIKTPGGTTYPFHNGTDFTGFTQVRSIMAGVVEKAGAVLGWEGGGTQVWVRNVDGSLARYLHLVYRSATVSPGQRVAEGQVLGTMGMTGKATGIHLHLEIVPKGATRQVDPVPYIRQRLAPPAPAALKPNQRRAIVALNGRKSPSTSAAIVKTVGKGSVLTLKGWARGTQVSGNDLWVLATDNFWYWTGGLSSTNRTGIAYAGPVRKTGRIAPNARSKPTTAVPVVGSLKPNTNYGFDAYTLGQSVQGNNVWFLGAGDRRWYWSGGFTSRSTAGLRKV